MASHRHRSQRLKSGMEVGAHSRNVRFCVAFVARHFPPPYIATPFSFSKLGVMNLCCNDGGSGIPRDSTSYLVRDWCLADGVVRCPPMLRLRPSIRSSRISRRHKTNMGRARAPLPPCALPMPVWHPLEPCLGTENRSDR